MTVDTLGDDDPGEFASPACFMHEVDPSYSGIGPASPAFQRLAILR